MPTPAYFVYFCGFLLFFVVLFDLFFLGGGRHGSDLDLN